jgi:drug/metabolite transporter (DMT)-like permease
LALKMNSQALPYVILLGFLWGSNLVAARFGLAQFHPLLFVALRMLLASVGHVAVYLFNPARPWPHGRLLWRRATWLGIFGTAVPMTATISALQYQSSGVTAVFITTAPALTVIMAHFLLIDESLSWRKSLGVLLSLAGALLLVISGESGLPGIQASPLGFGLVTLAMICGSGMAIYARRQLRDFDAFDVATIRMFVATAAVIPVALIFAGLDLSQVDGQGYFVLVYTAIFGAFAGLLLEFYIIKRFGATAAAMTAYVIPIVAALGGALLLNEQITAVMVAGMSLIVVGIAIINQRRRVAPTHEIIR